MKRKVTFNMVIRTSTFLGKMGRQLFEDYKVKYGSVSPVFMDNRIPHPVHFREGMQIRNYLRTLDDCQGWSDHDFDDTWTEVVEQVLKLELKGD
jgi:hypothetical protein